MVYDPSRLIDRRFHRHPDGPVVSTNERHVLRALQREPGLSRADLTGQFDLTQQSLHRIVEQLANRGMIRMGPPKSSSGRGQPSPTLFLQPSFAHSWGISLNAETLGIALMDFAGNLVADELHVLRSHSQSAVLTLASQRMAELSLRHRLDREACLGVGFGIVGYWVEGTRFAPPLTLRDWAMVDLGPLLSGWFNRPVWVENTANTAAVAEAFLGAGRRIPTFAHISMNHWLGSGLIQNGELWSGGNNNAGEFFSLYESEPRVRHPALKRLMELMHDDGLKVDTMSDILQGVDASRPAVTRWITEALPGFNRLLAALWSVFDPQAVVLGGQLPPVLAQMLIDGAKLPILRRYDIPRRAPKLLISDLGPNVAALGAAVFPLRVSAF
ncbi:ROK family transcriptional regulator [Falsirhodobacter sp. 20TX0035]|uniref:ROK family transcriptional regulator n=1 Tax=Falsirhodobacter sp. 20TX0035 TaxID=3022019 RepID=UPI00232B84D1|nr:ROK family transcriptional regulator [Falsirhodobacter sp. 20TX0035]MDB6454328.1 ROK family transcriptional regulator [Falsirhodobacter sp. 20TX0035]